MDPYSYLNVMIWINIRVCLPFTFLLITLCCLVRLDGVHVSYYMNLLLSNLVQLIILIALPPDSFYYWRYLIPYIIFASCALASLCFRMMIALERCCSTFSSSSSCITHTKGFVVVSVLVWVFCLMFVSLFISLRQELSFLIFALLPAPVLLICLVVSLKSIGGNMSVPTEEKRRTAGTLVVLLIHYVVSVVPIVISSFDFSHLPGFSHRLQIPGIYLTLFLLGYFFDLLLFAMMCKGLIEKLLICFCCCRKENVEQTDGSRSSV